MKKRIIVKLFGLSLLVLLFSGLSITAGAQKIGLYGGGNYEEDKSNLDKAHEKEKKACDDALKQAKAELEDRVKKCHDEACKKRAQEIYDIRKNILEGQKQEIEKRYKESLIELKKFWKKS